nr:putative ribonuclease H-like domain-containing protein [Tanacetum cinerariifolium]
MYNVNLKNIIPSGDLTCLFAKATLDESNLWPMVSNLCLSGDLPVLLVRRANNTEPLDDIASVLKTFIVGLENLLSLKVKIIRCDNGTEFKNADLNQFCGLKGIKREFSVPRTPQQNGIAKRKNKTLIEAARTMLADSLLPIPFWTEAVNTACYVQNRAYFKERLMKDFLLDTLYWSYMLFDIDSLSGTINYHPVTAENQTNSGAGSHDTFDKEKAGEEVTQTYVLFPVWSASSTNPQNNNKDALVDGKEHDVDTQKSESAENPVESVTSYRDLNVEFKECSNNSSNGVNAASSSVPTVGHNFINNTNTFSAAGPSNTAVSLTYGKSSFTDASTSSHDPDMPDLEDLTYSDDEDAVGTEADINNLESSIPVSPIPTTRIHKDHPISQIISDLSSTTQTRSMARAVKDQGGLSQMFDKDFHTFMFVCFFSQEEPKRKEGIDYEEVFAPVARIEAIRLFLPYASFIGFLVYQMDVNSAFLYETIEEEVYVGQPLGFEDPDHPDEVYKVVKALYGLHQAPRAWYETLATYLLENDDIIFGATNKDLCKSFEKLMKDRFQMSSMEELTFFLEKSDASEGFAQIIDFLSGSYIHYALTVSPHIYLSCIKQFWNIVVVKRSGDVTRLQALVDKKKIVISEDVIREILRLDDTEGVSMEVLDSYYSSIFERQKDFLEQI